jgi:peptidoglycan/xylan/chitin deacetylase (PgdA/CDA1 family)
LEKEKIRASFFFTGRFYRNAEFKNVIRQLKEDDHYLGAHSDQHLLYCDWNNRDSLLVTKKEFETDLKKNYAAMSAFGISKKQALYFLPPYEWYNSTIAMWSQQMNLALINFTPGTRSHADYTTPADKNYRSSEDIYNSIIGYEQKHHNGLNGFILLLHIGTDPGRTDKFYDKLPQLVSFLKGKGYEFQVVEQLLRKR